MLSNLNQNNVLRFFICDDNTVFTHLIKDCIERAMPPDRPYELFLFEDDKQLLDEWNKGFADAVLLDINMPYTALLLRNVCSKANPMCLFCSSQVMRNVFSIPITIIRFGLSAKIIWKNLKK